MATLWEWDSFDGQVQTEASAIRGGKPLTSLGQKGEILTVDGLQQASEWAWQQGDDVKAIAALLVAVTIDDNYWQGYYNLGRRYLTIGKRWQQAYVGRVRLTEGQSYIKSLFERVEFYESAVRHLGTALQLNPKNARGWCLLGQVQYYLGDYDQAHESLRKAFRLDPRGESGRIAKGSLEIFESSQAWQRL